MSDTHTRKRKFDLPTFRFNYHGHTGNIHRHVVQRFEIPFWRLPLGDYYHAHWLATFNEWQEGILSMSTVEFTTLVSGLVSWLR